MRRYPVLLVALFAGCLLAVSARALDLPQRKAGLWELKMSFKGRNLPGQVMRQCIDAKTDRMMNGNFGAGAMRQSCTQQKVVPSPGGFTVDSVCKFGGATTTSHAVIAGNFDSAYTVEVTSTREGDVPVPGMGSHGATHMAISAKWLGPCRAGQRPGDIMMGHGMKMNIFDLRKLGRMRLPRY